MESRVWFITGASRGMGLEFARVALANGQRVVATARKPQAVHDALGEDDRLLAVALDVTSEDSIAAAVEAARAHFGGIDILVNNAGYGIFGALEETTDAETRAIFDTNVFGPMNVIRAALPSLRESGFARIVNIASMGGYATDPGGALYDTTKFAIVGLTEVLEAELAEFGIQCMVVWPGMIRTNFFDSSSLKRASRTLDAYEGSAAHAALDYCLSHNYRQHGDPVKVAKLVFDVAMSERMPLWLPVGKEAMKKLVKKCERMVEETKPYYEASCDTSFPRPNPQPQGTSGGPTA
jgi:NAD(P)-dependent dehydrogenase (short-subunit alcohol dehydrogenase family)